MKQDYPTYHLNDDFRDKLENYVDQFMSTSETLFAKELDRVEQFVTMAKADKSKRDDHNLRRTEKVEYYLELLSFGIYDRLNREAFNRTKETVIIMPNCLTLHTDNCLRLDDEHGDSCEACISECQANEITQLAESYNATAVFSKRSLGDQIEYWVKQKKDIGVIGVACITMLASGMRRAAEFNIPTRGVLLNLTGCDHWNDNEFASPFSLAWLKEILKEKYDS